MARVFISHANEDDAHATRIKGWLEADGHTVFVDHSRDATGVGEDWEERILQALSDADAVVVVSTPAAARSAWCLYELAAARLNGSAVLPVVVNPGFAHPLLVREQVVDITADPADAAGRLNDALRRVDSAGGLVWHDGISPYPGLEPFDSDTSLVFFGRESETKDLTQQLRSRAVRRTRTILLIVGPSGSGKSSLLRAGVLPALSVDPNWLILTPVAPRSNPLGYLAAAIAATALTLGVELTSEAVRIELTAGAGEELIQDLLLRSGARHLLVAIDQFEEMITHSSKEVQREFAQCVDSLVGPYVQFVATARIEFFDRIVDSAFRNLVTAEPYIVKPLDRSTLRDVIAGPARAAGYKIKPRLVDRMVEDTKSGDALPLLAFTLAELARGLRRGGSITEDSYNAARGVTGSLERQAKAALEDAKQAAGKSEEEIIHLLLELVQVVGQHHTRRWVDADSLPEWLVRPFTEHRLLVTSGERGDRRIGFAHESVMVSWELLAAAIRSKEIALRKRAELELIADLWRAKGMPRPMLWERGQLSAALEDLGAGRVADELRSLVGIRLSRLFAHQEVTSSHVRLSAVVRQFLQASIRRDRFQRNRALAILTFFLVIALVGGVIGAVSAQRANDRLQESTARGLLAEAEATMAAGVDINGAVRKLLAVDHVRDDLTDDMLANTRTDLQGVAKLFPDKVYTMALSPKNGMLVVGYGGTVQLWDSVTWTPKGKPLLDRAGIDAVTAVAVSRDGNTVAAAMSDGSLHLWDANTRSEHSSIRVERGIESLAFGPDRKRVFTGSADGAVREWDIDTGQATRERLGPGPPVNSIAVSADGHRVVTAEGTEVRVTDLRTMQSQASELGQPTLPIDSVALSEDGTWIASGGADEKVRLWRTSGSTLKPEPAGFMDGHHGPVFSVGFNNHGADEKLRVISSGWDGTVRVWNPETRLVAGRVMSGHRGRVNAALFTADGRFLSGGDDGTVRVWDNVVNRAGASIEPPYRKMTSVAFSPDKVHIATGAWDGHIRLYRLQDRTPVNTRVAFTEAHDGPVDALAFNGDGTRIISGGVDGTVRLWNGSDGSTLGTLWRLGAKIGGIAFSKDGKMAVAGTADGAVHTLWLEEKRQSVASNRHSGVVTGVSFSADGKQVATSSEDGTARIWDPAEGEQLGDPIQTGHGRVRVVAFGVDGRLGTAGDDGTIKLWDTSGGPPTVLAGHLGAVYGLAFADSGNVAVSGGWDGSIRVWHVGTGLQIGANIGMNPNRGRVNAVSISPDGTVVAGAQDGKAQLWHVGEFRQAIGALYVPNRIYGMAFSPDGKLLVTGTEEGIVRVWRSSEINPETRPMPGHRGIVFGVAYHPKSDVVATAGEDGTLRLWNTKELRQIDMVRVPNRPGNSLPTQLSGVAFNADGSKVAVGAVDGKMRIWDVAHLDREPLTIEADPSAVFAVGFLPDGRVVSGGKEGIVRIWGPDGAKIAELLPGKEVTSLDVSRDGRIVTSRIDGSLTLSDTTGRGPDPWLANPPVATSARFTADGSYIVSAGDDGTVRLWKKDRRVGLPLLGFGQKHIQGMTVDSAGHRIAAAFDDGTIRIWHSPDSSSGREFLCSILVDPEMTTDRWNQVISPNIPRRGLCP
ncbi:nSTAND1 domain-containing NTPase [Nocardia goodfellowii]